MNNKELQKVFFKTFLVTIIAIVAVAVISVGTYYLITHMFAVEDKDSETTPEKTISMISEIRLGTTYMNLVYSVDEKNKLVENCAVEMFNSNTSNLDIITIPTNAEYTMSENLYKRLSAVNKDIPQVFKLSTLLNYFSTPDAYEYGQLIVEDMLGCDLSFYTAISSNVFEDFLTMEERSIYSVDGVKESYPMLVFSNQFKNGIVDAAVTEKNIPAYLSKLNDKIKTNLTYSNRLIYADAYLKVALDKVYYWHVYGSESDDTSTFTIDKTNTKVLISRLKQNAVYEQTQEEYNKFLDRTHNSSSKDLNIKVLNGADAAGQAGKYKKLLTSEGYKVVAVGDNDEAIDNSLIITNKESIGYDLSKYFKNATVMCSKDKVPDGVDILIIVGRKDVITE